MKKKRQNAIREILRTQAIQTQGELAEALQAQGFQVTQATVSRDMKEMHLIKKPGPEGGYFYTEPASGWPGLNDRLIRLLRDCVLQVEAAGQIVVVKTMSGAAGTAADALDTLEMTEIAGSIAGDNTIFLAARDHGAAHEVAERILGLIRQ